MPSLKDILPEIRAGHGNKSQVAKKLGIAPQQLGQYEKGTRKPKDYFFVKWHEVFGQDLKAMLTEAKKEANVSHGTENLTPVKKPSDNKGNGLPMDEVKKIIEGGTDYYLIPKVVIEGKYRMVAIEQIEQDKQQIELTKSELKDRQQQIADLTNIIKEMVLRSAPQPLDVKKT